MAKKKEFEVSIGRGVPKTLEAFALRHADKIEVVTSEVDGYFVYLRPGHCNGVERHLIIGNTIADIKGQWICTNECDCKDCQEAKANGIDSWW